MPGTSGVSIQNRPEGEIMNIELIPGLVLTVTVLALGVYDIWLRVRYTRLKQLSTEHEYMEVLLERNALRKECIDLIRRIDELEEKL